MDAFPFLPGVAQPPPGLRADDAPWYAKRAYKDALRRIAAMEDDDADAFADLLADVFEAGYDVGRSRYWRETRARVRMRLRSVARRARR